jgi:hypothetical protein
MNEGYLPDSRRPRQPSRNFSIDQVRTFRVFFSFVDIGNRSAMNDCFGFSPCDQRSGFFLIS